MKEYELELNEQNKDVNLKFVTSLIIPKDIEYKKKQFLAIASNSFDLVKCIGAVAYHSKSRKHFSEMKIHFVLERRMGTRS